MSDPKDSKEGETSPAAKPSEKTEKYEPPKIEFLLTDEDLDREIFYAGTVSGPPVPCLPYFAMIATPDGEVTVSTLKEGDLVYTSEGSGERRARKVARTSRRRVQAGTHALIRLTLADGRSVAASPLHPLADGRTFDEIKPGDAIEGLEVVSRARLPYDGDHTYDLLPEGITGSYWVAGVCLGSTLRRDEPRLACRFKRAGGVNSGVIQDCLALRKANAEATLVLNGSASLLWEWLSEPQSGEALLEKLLAKFPAVDKQRAENDLSACLRVLMEHEAIAVAV